MSSSVQARKAAGNEKYVRGEHREALADYEAALAVCSPGDPIVPVLLSNLAAVHLKMRHAAACVDCSRRSLDINPSHVKARIRLCRATAASGNFRAAFEVLDTTTNHHALDDLRRELQVAELRFTRADETLESGDHVTALEGYRDLNALLFDFSGLTVRMGRCYLAAGDVQRALHLSTSLLRQDRSDVAALMLQAEAQFQSISHHIDSDAWRVEANTSLKSLRHALSLDPDNKAAAQLFRKHRAYTELVEAVRRSLDACAHGTVEDQFTRVLELEPRATGRFAARCLVERGRSRLQQGKVDACICDCEEARRLDDRLSVASTLEAEALQTVQRWDEAVSVLEALYEWNKDHDVFWKVEWAKFEVRRARRPDYYAILSLEPSCSASTVKKSYLRMSVELHPDKQKQRNPDVDAKEAEDMFKMVVEAYEFLGDSAKRELYDKGYDAQGIREVLSVRKRFAGQAPCALCGEDESGKMGADGKWYCVRCWDTYYREKPEDAEPRKRGDEHSTQSSARRAGSAERDDVSCGPSQNQRENLPTAAEVAEMSVARLRDVLRMEDDDTVCATIDEMRARVRKHFQPLWCGADADATEAPSEELVDEAPVSHTLGGVAAEPSLRPMAETRDSTEGKPWSVEGSLPGSVLDSQWSFSFGGFGGRAASTRGGQTVPPELPARPKQLASAAPAEERSAGAGSSPDVFEVVD